MSAQVLPEPAGPMRLLEAVFNAVAAQPKPHRNRPHAVPDAADGYVTPLSASAEDVSRIRRVAHDFLVGLHSQPATREDALLVISELVTNAVTHALPPATLRLRCTPAGTLRIEVTDGGPRPHEPAQIDPMEEYGRGMQIVGALATQHGTATHDDGATRWAELNL
ncbi:ATP-binding protein [Streptomyces sp. NPDC056462]|uniref:ATP-binding protein n=1 Tax=Streptomyces sp. NPDC056462 TaxID=3345826 RepID=UPI00369FD974